MLHHVFDKSSSVPVIKNNNYESPWFWDMKMSGNTVMYWYLKNCVWFIKFHDKFEKLQDIKTISWVFLQNKKLTQCKRWHQITLFKTASLFLFLSKNLAFLPNKSPSYQLSISELHSLLHIELNKIRNKHSQFISPHDQVWEQYMYM